MIERIEVVHTKIPLKFPYVLSFGTVSFFESVLFITEKDGAKGFGEATYLPGYGGESASVGFAAAKGAAGKIVDLESQEAEEEVKGLGLPFTRSGALTAIETLDSSVREVDTPLIATLSGNSFLNDAERYLDEGYTEFKFKIGSNVESDIERVTELIEVVGDGGLRVDANGGYDIEDARKFLSRFGPGELQLLEQPLDIGNLGDHRELRGLGTPIMLDEDVWDVEDIERVSEEEAADMVKLKLMKFGAPSDVVRAIETAEDLGLNTVLGNGVQTDLSCLHEAAIWSDYGNELAGEMNGFLKMGPRVLKSPPVESSGRLIWGQEDLELSPAIEEYVVDRAVYG